MKLVEKNFNGYDFYIEVGNGIVGDLYNIVPTGSEPPKGGYKARNYIEKIKGVKFPDRYQPTLHGSDEKYPFPWWEYGDEINENGDVIKKNGNVIKKNN